MKTIEELAFAKYLNEQKLPIRKRIDPSNYLDWADFGKNEAQKWIKISDEIPDNDFNCKEIMVKIDHNCGYAVAVWDNLNKRIIPQTFCDTEQFRNLLTGVSHWKPIERK